MEEILVVPNNACSSKPCNNSLESKVRPLKDQVQNCPRCNSTNTKFCYYNNYSLSQPRFFCKACRRYWTAGGSLRNIPVGGGSRKNKRSATTSSTTSSKKINHDLVITPHMNMSHHQPQPQPHSQNPNMKFHQGQDLNLGFPSIQDHFKTINDLIQVPNFEDPNKKENIPSSSTNSSSHQLSALELLTGMTSSSSSTRGFNNNSFFPIQPIGDPRFSLPELKPSLHFTLDGVGSSGFGMQESNNGRILFPFEDLNLTQGPTTTENVDQNNKSQNHGDESTGYWNGVLGGGTW